MDLNIPEIRQRVIAERLASGAEIVATAVAEEFGISLDTIRRDIISLEEQGKAHRVRGGAVPVSRPAASMSDKLGAGHHVDLRLVGATLKVVAGLKTLLLDGGATMLAIAQALRPEKDLLVVTPSPYVAIACQTNGIDVFMLGGRLNPRGGISTGAHVLSQLGETQ